ncbi:MAG: secretion system protein TadC [Pseudonocardiales bacterium]|nr:MAG: secretion system protein TadC [Pseudonocardiales bacterium]
MTSLLLGLSAVGVAIGVLVFLLAGGVPAKVHVPAAAENGLMMPMGEVHGSSARGTGRADPFEPLPPLMQRLRSLAARLSPGNYGQGLQHRLDLAGNPRNWSADRVMAFKGVGLLLGLLLGATVGLKHGVGLVVYPLILGAAGFFVVDVLVRNLGEKRQIEIQKGLPDALDMMTVCVEAGLGFDSALARVARNLEGPMAEECARVLQEMQFGMSRAEALRALVGRTNVPELRTFVSSLIQSSELGISVGIVLREQAKEMRIRRRQRAEEKAQKLPVKILMPLITCLLPAMFVVILGPAIIQIVHTLGNLTK